MAQLKKTLNIFYTFIFLDAFGIKSLTIIFHLMPNYSLTLHNFVLLKWQLETCPPNFVIKFSAIRTRGSNLPKLV
jgi:hypothetical protein